MTYIWSNIATNGDPDPSTGHILEVGFYVTLPDAPYEFLGSVGYVIEAPVSYQEVIESMPPDVLERHEHSKLLQLLQHDYIPQPLASAELECIELISRFTKKGTGIMAGRDISGFVRPWMQEQMPKLFEMFDPDECLEIDHMVEFDPTDLPRRSTMEAEASFYDFFYDSQKAS